MKFRPHRGGLAEAMAEMVEVDGLQGLVAHLKSKAPGFGPKWEPEKLEASLYSKEDPRIGWKDVHIVCLPGWGPVGFCEGKPS